MLLSLVSKELVCDLPSVGVSALALRVATEEDKDTRQDLCLAGASLW